MKLRLVFGLKTFYSWGKTDLKVVLVTLSDLQVCDVTAKIADEILDHINRFV